MRLDNPLTIIIVVLMLFLLVIAGFVSSVSLLFAYLPGAREWVKEQIGRFLKQR
jgi:UPF0716 family protein affecting phage T7 exclusion